MKHLMTKKPRPKKKRLQKWTQTDVDALMLAMRKPLKAILDFPPVFNKMNSLLKQKARAK